MINAERVKLEELKKPADFNGDISFIDDAIEFATKKVEEIMPSFVHQYPSACSVDNYYRQVENASDDFGSEWTAGFWTGMLWLSYELTGNELFRAVAEAQFDDYEKRCREFLRMSNHDIGFIYSPSVVAQYKITGAKKAKELGLKAANALSKRFSEKAGIIQVRDRNEQGAFIIDCCMNLPLLYWAGKETGDREYYLKAMTHISKAADCMVRDDASSYAAYKIDEVTGEKVKGWQGQGYSDNSCWARGQSWIIYGLALSYVYTFDKDLLELAKRTANYFLNRLPSDHICNWDLIFTEDDGERDSSTAPVVACGLLEISKHLSADDEYKEIYKRAAIDIVRNLAEKYTTQDIESNGLLKHGVYCKNKGKGGLGDNECCIWGDYFYMEALTRLKKEDWNLYW
ncbi:MAG: glycoside hydrolase family 88 protein [Clostridia bacterium]|nr:glycoside hydrolase family 88 protein [Clostridia bacterium]